MSGRDRDVLIPKISGSGRPKGFGRPDPADYQPWICRHYGRPDFFATFTCNPKWDEITSNIPAGSSATNCSDVVSRVFSLKLKALMDELLKKHILGKTIADIFVVEFQKRGLPHGHILLIMDHDDKIRDIQGWQSVNQFPRIDRSSRRESRAPFNSVMKSSRADLISVKCRAIGPFDRSVSVKGKNTVVPARF